MITAESHAQPQPCVLPAGASSRACRYGASTPDTVREQNLDVLERTLTALGLSAGATHVRGRWVRQLLFASRDGSLRVTLVAGIMVET